jgi:propionyl-CoA carboxylase alpha chain
VIDVISSVLVANRGEIARRVFRTCRDLGIGCVAVYSDADRDAPHVREADLAVRLPGSTPAETYLRGDLLIDAARAAGADAVHPGYGFLSEHAAFAREVEEAGLTWIGPPPEAIEAMGSKVESKRLMAAAGVPVLPAIDLDAITAADLPVLVKASAGGGGRGMRVIRDLAELADQVAAARAEAASAFGDPTVFCESYLERGRHIEVQVLADRHGTVWAVGERECSIQRRHQKVVEEAPSPLAQRVDGLRERLFAAARAAAGAVGYLGAGTVEFLVDETGRFHFLEMNTRLQVEHPVTECVTGLDLVRLQIAVADGARLDGYHAPPAVPAGHAIEARLYAEDPAAGWQPQSGTLHHFSVPGVAAEFAAPRYPDHGIRLDSGVVDGSVVGVHYDPMLAKVIAWAPDRHEAARRLAAALSRARIHGLVTNRDLLVRVLRHPAFLAGETHTDFLAEHDLTGRQTPGVSVLAAALADASANRASATVLGGLPSGWRNLPSAPQRKRYLVDGDEYEVAYRFGRDGLIAEGHDGVRLVAATPTSVVLDVNGLRRTFDVARYPGLVCVDSALEAVQLRPVPRFPDPSTQVASGSLLAPMPGTVTRLAVAVGDQVQQGQPLLWLEAMKMEHTVVAPHGGVVTELPVAAGRQVEVGTVLAVVSGEEVAE